MKAKEIGHYEALKQDLPLVKRLACYFVPIKHGRLPYVSGKCLFALLFYSVEQFVFSVKKKLRCLFY